MTHEPETRAVPAISIAAAVFISSSFFGERLSAGAPDLTAPATTAAQTSRL
jgi:hypothetical protein